MSAERRSGRRTITVTICTPRPVFVPIIPTTLDTVAQAAIITISPTQSELWWLDRCGLLARRYTHTVHLRRDAEQGGT
jgi:hypothetical protein